MKVVTGIVSRVRHTAEVSGNRHGVGTTQVLGFRIGRQAVELRMPALPPIEDGDEVAVAGEVQNGTLVARAYRNFDNNAHDRWQHSWLALTLISLIFGLPLVLLTAGAVLRGNAFGLYGIAMIGLPTLLFPFWAVSAIRGALKTNRAARMVSTVN